MHFFDFELEPKSIHTEWNKVFGKVIDSGSFLQSRWNQIFEESFKVKLNRSFALGVSNRLDGLILSLRALGLASDLRIAVPAHTFIAVWNDAYFDESRLYQ